MLVCLLASVALAQDVPVTAVVAPREMPPEEVSFRISIVPGIGLNADADASVDGASVGFMSHAQGLQGFDGEMLTSWVDGDVEGVQAAGLAAVATDVEGLQLSAVATWARGDARAGQFSGGAALVEGNLYGVQGSTFLNVALGEHSEGVQATAGLNVARGIQGVQAAPMNVADRIEGAQLGLLNIGNEVEGLQLGLVNVARTSKVSIAPINIIGDGLHRVDVWVSDSAVASAGLKFGSKNVYTLIGAGWVNPSQSWWTFGGGMGVHLSRDPLWLEIDDSVWGLASGNVIAPGLHNKLRVQVGIDLLDHFAPFAGVSMNTWVGNGDVWPRPVELPSRMQAGHRLVTWPGVHAGVSF